MAKRTGAQTDKVIPVEDYEHVDSTRVNNPPAGLAHLDREETPVRTLTYDPHLDPQLVWAGKVERSEVEVPAPSVHVHEELSAQKIVGSVRRQRLQQPLFDVDKLDPDQAVEFYKHDLEWSNRMILGDSLTVMTSLLERERLGGQVQCVFIDPPYGVNYKSNFQPSLRSTDVAQDDAGLTREPEMIQAYRDTWVLQIHSYLSYLRDRISVARELLAESGSIFIQISDDHVHQVRVLLDEVFGTENYVAQITFQKTATSTGRNLGIIGDYLLWYAKDVDQLKYRQLYALRALGDDGADAYSKLELTDGTIRNLSAEEKSALVDLPPGAKPFRLAPLTSQAIGRKKGPGAASWFDVEIGGKSFNPGASSRWKTNEEGMERLRGAGRLMASGNSLNYVRYLDDFNGVALANIWGDTAMSGSADRKRYVVQTNPKVIARCILMTTDPGDLVVDPTCGGGTSALVAEQYGRRWITMDTSRVALAVARERLLTAVYDYYRLAQPERDVDGGFVYETQQRVTLGQIAKGEEPETVVLHDRPLVDKKKTRVSGPFTVEALSRYSVNPLDPDTSAPVPDDHAASHVESLLDALRVQGIPRPGSEPLSIESLSIMAAAEPLQAEGIVDLGIRRARFAVSLGPQFGAITMSQVSDALRSAIGFDLVVFAGFAVSADAQDKLGSGKIGGTDVALLLANPDLLVGDLLKNTATSQTFRLYASPDAQITHAEDGYRVEVLGLDSFDAATGATTSFGKTGIQAWFLDDDFDGTVFRVAQAFFPVTDAWEKLERALRTTVDAALLSELHGWTSLPFDGGDHGKVAVRVVANDGNAAEIILSLPGQAK
jgi:adenine-specific DNA-methyltransferase